MNTEADKLKTKIALQAFVDRLEGILGGPTAIVLVTTVPGAHAKTPPLNIISNIEGYEGIQQLLEIAARIAGQGNKEAL